MNYNSSSNNDNHFINGWISTSDLKLVAQSVGTPVFLYSEQQLIRNVQRIKDAAVAGGIGDRVELYVPFFPNSNPHIVRSFQDMGVGLLLQLPSEYEILRRFGFKKFIVSTGHVSNEDIDYWDKTGYPLFLSSLDEIRYLLCNHPGASVNVRFDSLNSGKPGLKYSELKNLADELKQRGRRLDCFELYCGSGHTIDDMISVIEQVFMIFHSYFPDAKAINFAGGFGFSYEEKNEHKKHFEWDRYFRALREIADHFRVPGDVKFLFEPARDVLGDIGALFLNIERSLIRHPGVNRVLTNGSRVLMPSAQYKERRHNVVFLNSNLTEIKADRIPASIRGRGILRHDYVLPGDYPVPECIGRGDHLLILDVGAYCATQHMEFLNIPPAAEVLIDQKGSVSLITSHGDKFDKWRYVLPEKKELQRSVAHSSVHGS